MVESLRYYFEQKKPDTEEYILHGFIYFKSQNGQYWFVIIRQNELMKLE